MSQDMSPLRKKAESLTCPRCGAIPHEPCKMLSSLPSASRYMRPLHSARYQRAREALDPPAKDGPGLPLPPVPRGKDK